MRRTPRRRPKGTLSEFFVPLVDHGPKPKNKAARILHIVRLMAGNLWVSGVTIHDLSKQWGIAVESLKKDSAEASRTFTADPVELAELRARWRANVETAKSLALQMGKPQALSAILKVEARYLESLESPDDLPPPAPIDVDRSVTINFVPTVAPEPGS
jgi:hypothetical protein